MSVAIPSSKDRNIKPQVTAMSEKRIKVEEFKALMKLCYEYKFKDSKITLTKRPAIILSDPNCEVVLMVQYDMARYNNEQDAEEALRGKLVSDSANLFEEQETKEALESAVLVEEPEFDMMDGPIRILLDDLAKFGTLMVAYYRTPIWEIYWRFVETEEAKRLEDGDPVKWLRDPKKDPPLDPDNPDRLHEPGYLEPLDLTPITQLDPVSRWFKASLPSPGLPKPEVTDACEPVGDTGE